MKKNECEAIARQFCQTIGAVFIYADCYSVGYELGGVLIKKTWPELADIVASLKA